MDHPLYRPLLAASITASSFLVGCQLSLSHVSLATILGLPLLPENIVLSQFRTIFGRGFHLCPSSAIFSGLCCFANAAATVGYTRHVAASWAGGKAPQLLLAGSLMIGIVPYTLALIVPVEEKLLRRESKLAKDRVANKLTPLEAGPDENDDTYRNTREMLSRWNALNYGRTLLPVLGIAVAWTLW